MDAFRKLSEARLLAHEGQRQLAALIAGQFGRLGPILAKAACLMLLAGVVVGSAVLGAVGLVQSSLQFQVGDVVWIGPKPDMPLLPTMTVQAVVVSAPGLPEGARCTLGLGDAADAGGSLIVLRRDAEGDYVVSWSGTGRSARAGQDCGHAADLRLTQDDVQDMQVALLLAPLAAANNSII